jgi:cell wall-associated NlpC family hydrolase
LKKNTSEHSSEASTESNGNRERPDASEEKSDSNPSPAPTADDRAGSDSKANAETAAPMATIKPEALREFAEQPAEIQGLIRSALALTEQNLTYKYGSADPGAGGMDCSGFIYYVLSNAGYKDVPRDSAGQYEWVRKISNFHAVLSRSGDSFELNDLRPGDLLFWSGTYKIDREIPITHVMIYLGKEKSTDKPVMVGATDGRSYNGVRRYGVSVFDFKMPSGEPNKADPGLTAKFEGYASIPRLRTSDVASKTGANPDPVAQGGEETSSAKRNTTPASWGNGD